MKPTYRNHSSSVEQEIHDYLQILKNNPSSRVFAPLAEALIRKKELHDAEEVCKLGLEANPEFSDGYLAYARVLFYMTRYHEALEQINRAIKLNPDKIENHLTAAEIYTALNQPQKASHSCMQALDIDPNNQQLGRLLRRLHPKGAGYSEDNKPRQTFRAVAGTVPSRRHNHWITPRYIAKPFQKLVEKTGQEAVEKLEEAKQPFSALSPGSQPPNISINQTEAGIQAIIDSYSNRSTPQYDDENFCLFQTLYSKKLGAILSILLVLAVLGLFVAIVIHYNPFLPPKEKSSNSRVLYKTKPTSGTATKKPENNVSPSSKSNSINPVPIEPGIPPTRLETLPKKTRKKRNHKYKKRLHKRGF